MGMATRIYGCIVEYGLETGEMRDKIYSHNQKIIDKLPTVDEWPPLTRKMFANTDNAELPNVGPDYAYSGRIIHFGGNFRSIEHEWKEWRIKFESLLLELLWTEADVHIKTEYSDIMTLTWRIDLNKWSLYKMTEIIPIKAECWDFKGKLFWEEGT